MGDHAYNHPNYAITRQLLTGNLTGADAASINKFHFFLAAKLKAVHGTVVTAGTDTAAAFDVYVGTASVGSLAFGTNTAGVQKHTAVLDAAVPQNGVVEIKGKANSATLVASLCLEYEVTPSADES